jgi:hypothetical protein
MVKEKKSGEGVSVDTAKRGFFWFLMLLGIIFMVYFTLSMIINIVYGVDLAGKGVNVVIREAVFENGTMVKEAETVLLSGVSGWVAVFGPWIAVNVYLLILGGVFFAIGYALTPKKEDRVAVSLFKARMLGGYLAVVALLVLSLGLDRVFFVPHEVAVGTLGWIDWYIFEFLAYLFWAVILAVLAVFFLRVQGKSPPGDDED